MISLTLAVLGTSAAALQIADIFLTESQKLRVQDRTLRFWVWLDDQKKGRFIRLLWHRVIQNIIFALYAAPALVVTFGGALYYIYSKPFAPKDSYPVSEMLNVVAGAVALSWFLALVVAFFVFHRPFSRRVNAVADLNSYWRLLLPRTLLFSLSLPALLLSLALHPIASTVVWLALSPFVMEANILWNLLLASLTWLALMYALAFLTAFVAYVIRRLLEQPKGVLAGAAALLIALSALLKSLQ